MIGDKRISRRALLRNIGLAGAAAWAAPVLAGGRASASVDRCRKRKSRQLCMNEGSCDICCNLVCGTCNSDVGDGSYCFARMGAPGCYCAEDVFCAEAGQCTTDADCRTQGLGNICITINGCTGCSSSMGVCSTRCCRAIAGPPAARKPRRLGRTAVRVATCSTA